MPHMDYKKLRGRMVEFGLTQKDLAQKIGTSHSQLNRKLAGDFSFRQSEIQAICEVLQIGDNEIKAYFFTP